MTRAFLPEYTAIPVGRLYRPAYKLFEGDRWHMVSRDGHPVSCQTFREALEEARCRVRAILNPPLRSEVLGVGPQGTPQSSDLGAADWLAGKGERHSAEVVSVFGAAPPKTVRSRRGLVVEVEYRRRRA